MVRTQARWTYSVLGLFLFLVGCGDSGEILEGPQRPPVADEVTAVLQQVLLPALKNLAVFSPVNQPTPRGNLSPGAVAPACASLDPLCRSGRYEVCGDTREGMVVFRFEQCDRASEVLNGSWELTRDGILASARFDLSLNDLDLSGGIAYLLDDMCWSCEFHAFEVVRGDRSAIIEGNARYCFGSGVGAGRLRVSVTGPSAPFDLVLDLDSGKGNVVVRRGDAQNLCRFAITDGVADCEND